MTVPGVGGAPLMFKTVEELQQKINDYFESCWEESWTQFKDKEGNVTWKQNFNKDGNPIMKLKERPTVTGLALALDTTRHTLIDYENRNDEYSIVIKKAKTLVEYYYEKGTIEGDIHPAVGIFGLKNFGWTDAIQINTNNAPEQLSPNDIKQHLASRKTDNGQGEKK